MNQKTYILSLSNNSFVWLPPKTGSSFVSWVLGHFDFWWYRYDELRSDYKLMMTDLAHFGHDCQLPPNHENFNFICTTRNPYDRMVSYYLMNFSDLHDEPTSENFENFIEHFFSKEKHSLFYRSNSIFNFRKPDYSIRLENLYEDLLEIPFIKISKLNSCGILEEMCSKKIKKGFEFENKQYLYTDKTREKVYNHFKKDFELFGYTK